MADEFFHFLYQQPASNSSQFLNEGLHDDASYTFDMFAPEVQLSEGTTPILFDDEPSPNTMDLAVNGGDSTRYDQFCLNGDFPAFGQDLTIKVEDGSVLSQMEQKVFASQQQQPYATNQFREGKSVTPTYFLNTIGDDIRSVASRRARKRLFWHHTIPLTPTTRSQGSGPRQGASMVSSTLLDNSLGKHISAMVGIEKERLEMERIRAQNDRIVKKFMMETLQTLLKAGPKNANFRKNMPSLPPKPKGGNVGEAKREKKDN